ncbi:MAG: hypothetical protein DWQ31_08275 [Planctomycetota bacterium]|nr:MAG: hypothetical protein DWQ31_08275 [Planctomycetota bacterium]REJ89220.1 MAG: hypothetical protein DWQ35_18525 [Planctomycetota bacterium]REK17709.1 MAG: hypothetical protein DWQ42_21940 [Planctomycetota bacterium]REK46762.1 MAG: hypothetical protein DWQ46_06050 [Planctomycetota bacterium]
MRIGEWLLFAIALTCVVSAGGCKLIATAAYLTMPNDVEAEYDGLKGERVVVICHDVGGLGYQDAGVPSDLARLVGQHLDEHVRRVEVVSPDEVNDWVDSNEVRLAELGKAMDADKVVSIELEHYNLYRGPSLYQGHAEATLVVYDVDSEDSYELKPLESVYPPHSGVELTESENQFRRRYLRVLAADIGRRFYDHESIVASKDRLYPNR